MRSSVINKVTAGELGLRGFREESSCESSVRDLTLTAGGQ